MISKQEKREILIKLRDKALKDESLPLKDGATNLVFGEGNVDAEVFFIGEGPGYWEDIKARPFVGNAGALLNQMFELVKIDRKDVFITNVIMYRPPNNRDPQEDEIGAFAPYVDGIIETIDPKLIVTLGRYSMNKFLPNVLISGVHGKPQVIVWKHKNITVLPMYHPAAALRNGDIKLKFRNDFEKIPKILEDIKSKVDGKINAKDKDKQLSLV